MYAWLQAFLGLFRRMWKRPPANSSTSATPSSPPSPSPFTDPRPPEQIAMDIPAPPVPPAPDPPQTPNRHARRILSAAERSRRKHDVFVTPKGPQPTPIKRAPRTTSPKPRSPASPPLPEPPTDDFLIEGADGKLYRDREMLGEFTFRDTILDQLDHYWVYLRRMKARDPDSYGFYRKVGATIVPPITHFFDGSEDLHILPHQQPEWQHGDLHLSPWWAQNRPSFGCVTYGIGSHIDKSEQERSTNRGTWWTPRFMYFCKFKNVSSGVEHPRQPGDFYKVTLWWDTAAKRERQRRGTRRGGTPEEFWIWVSADAKEVRPLKTMVTHRVEHRTQRRRIMSKNGKLLTKKSRCFISKERIWGYDEHWYKWAREYGETVENQLTSMFVKAARTTEWSNYSMVRVAVHNGDLTAVFGIDPRRLSYFFQDRDITLTVNGSKKRIFHIVKPHERHTKHGTVAVPFSFRGLKEFTWAGYEVEITVPHRDHFMMTEYNVASEDVDKNASLKGLLTQPQMADKIVQWMDEGLGAHTP